MEFSMSGGVVRGAGEGEAGAAGFRCESGHLMIVRNGMHFQVCICL